MKLNPIRTQLGLFMYFSFLGHLHCHVHYLTQHSHLPLRHSTLHLTHLTVTQAYCRRRNESIITYDTEWARSHAITSKVTRFHNCLALNIGKFCFVLWSASYWRKRKPKLCNSWLHQCSKSLGGGSGRVTFTAAQWNIRNNAFCAEMFRCIISHGHLAPVFYKSSKCRT